MCCISVVLVTMETKLYKLKDLELNIISFPWENTFTIDSFRYIKIHLGSEAWRTQGKEIEGHVYILSFVCVFKALL